MIRKRLLQLRSLEQNFLLDRSRSNTHANCTPANLKVALALIDTLFTELKNLDDKMILTEVHLLESWVYSGIGNLAKAKVRRPSLLYWHSSFNSLT
jgi:hypothetical protein